MSDWSFILLVYVTVIVFFRFLSLFAAQTRQWAEEHGSDAACLYLGLTADSYARCSPRAIAGDLFLQPILIFLYVVSLAWCYRILKGIRD